LVPTFPATRIQFERVQQQTGFLLLFAFRTLEPVGRLMAHDMGDLAPHVKFADAIRIMFLAKLIRLRF
jgi:hypothetical protein